MLAHVSATRRVLCSISLTMSRLQRAAHLQSKRGLSAADAGQETAQSVGSSPATLCNPGCRAGRERGPKLARQGPDIDLSQGGHLRCPKMPVEDLVSMVDDFEGDCSSSQQLLALLASMLDRKNAEIKSLADCLEDARMAGYSLQRHLSDTHRRTAALHSQLRQEQGKAARLRLAVREKESTLEHLQRQSALRNHNLAQRVVALEEEQQVLRRCHEGALQGGCDSWHACVLVCTSK